MMRNYPVRRRANSHGHGWDPQSPTTSRNRGVLVSSPYSNVHVRYKIHGGGGGGGGNQNQKLRLRYTTTKISWSAKTIVFIVTVLSTIKGMFFAMDHFLSETGVLLKLEDGSRRILSPDQMNSNTGAIATKIKSKSFAVIINTYKRPDMLKRALVHYAEQCGVSTGVSQVFVIWADQTSEPPMVTDIFPKAPLQKIGNLRSSTSRSSSTSSSRDGGGGGDSVGDNDGENIAFPYIEFVRVPKDSLNSRFLPIENLETKAVFMVDDDVRVDCQSLQDGFEAWTYHPNAMVGYYPRLASLSGQERGSNDEAKQATTSSTRRIYHTWPMVYAQHRFNMVLTKASFFHSKYMDMYHDDKRNPREVLEYIDEKKNCEDIAMSFLVARNTQKSVEIDMETSRYCRDCPVFTSGKIADDGLFSGISTGGGGGGTSTSTSTSISLKGHMDTRSMCLDDITAIYEKQGWDYPLSDVDLGDQSWIHHFFWWQYAPSNVFEWFSIGNLL